MWLGYIQRPSLDHVAPQGDNVIATSLLDVMKCVSEATLKGGIYFGSGFKNPSC